MALTAGEVYSGGQVRDADGRTVVVVEGGAGVATGAGGDGQPGVVAPMGGPGLGVSNAAVSAASRSFYARFTPQVNFSATLIAFVVTTAATVNDSVDVGIYDANLNRLVSSGLTAGKVNATGVQSIAITSTPLVAGTVYYAAFAYSTTGGTLPNMVQTGLTPANSASFQEIFGAGAPKQMLAFQAASPLGATATFSFDNGNVPYLAVRAS